MKIELVIDRKKIVGSDWWHEEFYCLHRRNGIASNRGGNYKRYSLFGLNHNATGPAFIWQNKCLGSRGKDYYLFGSELTKVEWEKKCKLL